MPSIDYKRSLVLLFLGVVLATGAYLRTESQRATFVKKPLLGDAKYYVLYAYNLRFKHTYSATPVDSADPSAAVPPDALRAPGYPLFLYPFVDGLPTGDMLDRITSMQVVLSIVAMIIVCGVFAGFMTPVAAVSATLLTALSPHLIIANSYVVTETLFCFFLIVLGQAMVWCARKPSHIRVVLTGMAMGAAALVRPGLMYLPAFLLPFWLVHYHYRQGRVYFLIAVTGFMIVFSPWILRNLAVIGKTGDDTLKINFLHHGMYPNFTYQEDGDSRGYPYRFDPRAAAVSENQHAILAEIVRRFKEEPIRHLRWFLLGKVRYFWSWDLVQGPGGPFIYLATRSPYFDRPFFQATYRFMAWLHWPLAFLAMLGSVVVWLPGDRTGLSPPALVAARFFSCVILYYTAIHMIGAPFPRYSIPLRPYMYGLAVLTVQVAVSQLPVAIKKRFGRNRNGGRLTRSGP